jgi:hypothetical protein
VEVKVEVKNVSLKFFLDTRTFWSFTCEGPCKGS